jgi:uncharacterized protein YifN (PemK superfamily)
MALAYQPSVQSVLMCDFKGMVEPEMVKIRPVVVISRNRHNRKLVTIVPISSTAPLSLKECHYELPDNPMPGNAHVRSWAKCDMVTTVSIARLDRVKVRTAQGRNYIVPVLSDADFERIRQAVLHGIGMGHLAQ